MKRPESSIYREAKDERGKKKGNERHPSKTEEANNQNHHYTGKRKSPQERRGTGD